MPRILLIIALAACGLGLLLCLSWGSWVPAGLYAVGCFGLAVALDRVPE